jgi:hypothetical protein
MRNRELAKLGVSMLFRSVDRTSLAGGALVALLAAAACSSSDGSTDGGSGGGDDGGTIDMTDEIGGPYTDPGPGGAFVAVPLIDDNGVDRKGSDQVSGIYVESSTKVLIVTRGANNTAQSGGAVFKATSAAVTAVAYSSVAEQADYVGIDRITGGYVALTAAEHLVSSDDGGATFRSVIQGAQDQFGTEDVLALRVSSRGVTVVRDNGIISTSKDPAPAMTSDYTTIWSPDASPQAGLCAHGPRGSVPPSRYGVYVNDDASFLAYASRNASGHPEVCVSVDAGKTFHGYALDVPDAAANVAPTGVAFATRKTGIAWFGPSSGGAYIRRTINGGSVWKTVALPAAIAAHDLELPTGFFAPDGNSGWLAGYDHTANAAVALRTFDRGATWSVVAGVPEAVNAASGNKLTAGFAVDATHIWVGGDFGVVLHN